MIFLLVGLLFAHLGKSTIIYVSENADILPGGQTGKEWESAFFSLDDALFAPTLKDGDSILMAEGTYFSDLDRSGNPATNNQQKTFYITKDISIFGGFPHGAESFADRNTVIYETALRGGSANLIDNSYHVLFIDSASCLLDGLVIENGNAKGAAEDAFGGGIYASPEYDDIQVILRDCVVRNNQSTNNGAGIRARSTNQGALCFEIYDCQIIKNETLASGGAIAIRSNSNQCFVAAVNTLFAKNEADASAGAMSVSSEFGGKTFVNVSHCTFAQNHAALFGGSIRAVPAASGDSIRLNAVQCIFALNSGIGSIEVWTDDDTSMEIINSLVEESSCAIIDGNGTREVTCDGTMFYAVNPQFVDTSQLDYRLLSVSPVINPSDPKDIILCSGANKISPSTDLAGIARDATPDYGAYEYQCVDHIQLQGNLEPGVYEAALTIKSDGKVLFGRHTTLDAGDSIELLSGFEVGAGSALEISLDGCEPNE